MSIQFGVAAALQLGTVEECGYHRLEDAGIHRRVARACLDMDETLTAWFPTTRGAEVRVSLARIGPRRANEIQVCVDRLETETDAGRLASLCSLSAPTGAAHRTQSRAGRSRP